MNKRVLSILLLAPLCWSLLVAAALCPGRVCADPASVITPQYYPIVISNLRNTVSNIGTFGTRFGSAPPEGPEKFFPGRPSGTLMPVSSCEWPAGSRNHYLNEGELWVGAIMDGDTAVTTGRFSGQEWVPLEGIGTRTGSSAFSDKDTYTRYNDGTTGPVTSPLHVPLGIQVTQLNFAWAGDDHIIHALLVKNTGPDDLDSVYIGFCWDFDVSSAGHGDPGLGDMVGLDAGEHISYMYDLDGDGGRSPGYIGGAFIYRRLAGHSWWAEGQDPESDAQRYALMAGGLMGNPSSAADYRVLQTIGPYDLPSGRLIPVLHVLAVGDGLSGLQGAVADAKTRVGEFLEDEGDSTLATGEEHVIAVTLDESKKALGKVMFAVDWEFCNLGLYLVDPYGREIRPQTAVNDPRINYTSGPHHKSFLVSDPQTGDWEMRIGYLSGPPSFPYHHSVTLFDVPYDEGLLMDTFDISWAYINFGGLKGEGCVSDSFEVNGEFELSEGHSFDPDRDPVFVRMGPYTETIPESSFVLCPEKYECYEYYGAPPGIRYMVLDFYDGGKGTWGWFDVYGGGVDMSEAELLTLVRLAIGENTGFEAVLLEDHGDEWWYCQEEKGKTRAGTAAATDQLPGAFTLSQNYPNPFNASTVIDYHLARPADIQLALYNVRGQRVAVLADGQQPAGTYRVIWDGKDSLGRPVGSGIYLCQLQAGGTSRTRKMILLR